MEMIITASTFPRPLLVNALYMIHDMTSVQLWLDDLEFVVLIVIDSGDECLFLKRYLIKIDGTLVLLLLSSTALIVVSCALRLGHLATISTPCIVVASVIIIEHLPRSHLLFFNVFI
jgi:hypothetical protein